MLKKMHLENPKTSIKIRKNSETFYRYGFFLLMLSCMLLASIQPNLGGANGIIII